MVEGRTLTLGTLPPVKWVGRAGITQLALSAIDIALWDLKAKLAELPLWKLLGGATKTELMAYNTDIGWLSVPLDKLVSAARKTVQTDGFRGIKIKVGSADPSIDLKRLEAVRRAVGDSVMLAIDGNGKWDLPTAIRFCRAAEAFDVYWFEEPLWYDDVAGHAALARSSRIPIALGEQLYSLEAFSAFMDAGAVHYVQPDVTRLAGVTDFLRVADAAHIKHLPVAAHVGDMGQIHVHLAYHHVACPLLEYIPWIKDVFDEPILVRQGNYLLPSRPGASSTPLDSALEAYGKSL